MALATVLQVLRSCPPAAIKRIRCARPATETCPHPIPHIFEILFILLVPLLLLPFLG